MSIKKVKQLPTTEELKLEVPLSDGAREVKLKRDREISDVISGVSDKFLLIMGPCSADKEKPVMEYMYNIGKLQKQVYDRILIIPRLYTNKPRTNGKGYKGPAVQPCALSEPDLSEGLRMMRNMHVRTLEETGMSTADEMLYPGHFTYLDDVLGYVAVGARSVENQQHRIVASGVDVPVGMKNPTSGDLSVMLNSVEAAQASHIMSYNGSQVET